MSETGLNPREQTGRRMRRLAMTVLGAPLALALLPSYLLHAHAGHGDRWGPYSYAASGLGMLVLPLWILLLVQVFA